MEIKKLYKYYVQYSVKQSKNLINGGNINYCTYVISIRKNIFCSQDLPMRKNFLLKIQFFQFCSIKIQSKVLLLSNY